MIVIKIEFDITRLFGIMGRLTFALSSLVTLVACSYIYICVFYITFHEIPPIKLCNESYVEYPLHHQSTKGYIFAIKSYLSRCECLPEVMSCRDVFEYLRVDSFSTYRSTTNTEYIKAKYSGRK